jgi:hypothetical protein
MWKPRVRPPKAGAALGNVFPHAITALNGLHKEARGDVLHHVVRRI